MILSLLLHFLLQRAASCISFKMHSVASHFVLSSRKLSIQQGVTGSSGPPVKERFVCRLQLVLSAWCLLNWEEICSLNVMHLAMTALSSLKGLLAVQILPVIRADGIDINISSWCMLFSPPNNWQRWSDIFVSNKTFEWCGVSSNICSPSVMFFICSH